MNARPKKSFGQHFLHEKRYIERIVSAISPKDGDVVVEIGPGEGALTLPLLAVAHKMTAIELDTDLIPDLQARAAAVGELEIIHSDVLKVDFSELARARGVERLRIAGNLPYYISSPILFHCVDHSSAIQDMHFMLQKEVVDRMAAEPGSKVYGRLSVMLQLACRVEPLFTVPPGAFRPPPKVDSAVVRVIPLPAAERHDADPRRVHDIVKAAFAQRRKTLNNALRQVMDSEAIRSADVDPKARAETLSPADFVRLAKVPVLPA
ncbi:MULTISPECIES: 16S rRNA (adenine(1518)-N(6)/adenine(1519)-N(6))-dimethyltransferase RsmA [Dyella]|uniref:Ribosomal RNA small subunit methyltransferase A n=2 Tax=Dyella TaxID=231454 RepID=A0A4R0YKI5_9GAMM|nr:MULTISPECIES: 16S rRNA (adenine(1518)-N(6)/adenine(1519)-N(6))-dimethyltransferase RsmA [Dyella]TBR36992.1 16S rRNA (adenine(1518)-N(6)/adenine(1519)-N(6))-dimethyltransferase RsmA [Dyella terrae]TCI07918.1 16S rRNA (adenine(1518)-N(6)/adenine(1519)-N(6))-dimethyltransferase RsmA [Dyella soli]